MSVDSAAADARSVASAATSFLRSVRSPERDLDTSLDRLEIQARRAIETSEHGFDSSTEPVSDEVVLAEALAQLGIGVTLITAESAAEGPEGADQLEHAVTELEATASALETGAAVEGLVRGFDATPGGVALEVDDAALQALEEMSAAAGGVADTLLDKARKPLLKVIPEQFADPLARYGQEIGGRLLRWGLRAVQRGLELVLSLVDVAAVERVRDSLDLVLAGLDRGEAPHVLMSAAIGAQRVRSELATTPSSPPASEEGQLATVEDLVVLTDRFARLCSILRKVAAAVAGLAAALALLQLTLPHATAVTLAGLALVLGAVVVIGRDYTGASDLPGRVRGVRLVLGR